jgi:hypothetical protein
MGLALTLRLAKIKGVSNYEVNLRFDDIGLTGCSVPSPGFESDAGWTLSRSGGSATSTSLALHRPMSRLDAQAIRPCT